MSYALHCANRDLRLRIVAEVGGNFNPGEGSPAVLTDDQGGWYSADLVYDGKDFIAYAVNGYGHESEALSDARSRGQLSHIVVACRCGGQRRGPQGPHALPPAAGLHCFECGAPITRLDVRTRHG